MAQKKENGFMATFMSRTRFYALYSFYALYKCRIGGWGFSAMSAIDGSPIKFCLVQLAEALSRAVPDTDCRVIL
jgi:hypothetical protein